MGLALAAVGFVGTYTWGLGWARVWDASIAPTVGPGAWRLQSWDLTLADLCWWLCEKQRLRSTRVDSQHTHGYRGAKGSANNSVLCEPAQWMKGDIAEYTHRWTGPVEEYSVASLPVRALQSRLPHTAYQKCSSEMELGASTATNREQTLPWTGQWQPQSKEEALLNIQCRLWSPRHQSHLLSRG